ncbi:aminopeptidase P family protein [Rhodovulum sp. DZ06]|uniref:aminopeptidase P family protein n=1 Tax=Rhodovulum sp. DZ06 TaxID=3425126 RepID=UPI003D33015A
MLQSFDARADGAAGPARLAALRATLDEAGLAGFMVPRADAHMGENVAPRDERLAWLTGFTGSAGFCIAGAREAALFVDGRYTLQAAQQTAAEAFTVVFSAETPPEKWLESHAQAGERWAYDPWLHPRAEIDRLTRAAEAAGAVLVPHANLVDAIWEDQPAPPAVPATPHDVALAGRTSADKRRALGEDLAAAKLHAAAITLPDSIAWLLNIRGGDAARMPAVHAFALLHRDGRVALFADPAKFGPEVRAHLGNEIMIEPPEAFEAALDALRGARVAVDKDSAPAAVSDRLVATGAEVVWRRDPCILPKACKTPEELDGSRAAHRRDGAAMANFLHWLDGALEGVRTGARLTEIEVVEALEGFRAETGALADISFETICGAGPNGAIVHYRVTRESDRAVTPDSLLLIDSGGQYRDGTTDITRTVFTGGTAPEGAAIAYTAVLRGMIELAAARWPEGLEGRHLDALARAPLWAEGLDYDHGTGHGVGAYLGVHEGPASLSRRSAEPIRPGMILSDEPGCYRAGAWGIRIENLVTVTPPAIPGDGERAMLAFETLTLAPIDRALILPDRLGPDARAWLDAYHARVLAEIGPLVGADVRAWLTDACAPL